MQVTARSPEGVAFQLVEGAFRMSGRELTFLEDALFAVHIKEAMAEGWDEPDDLAFRALQLAGWDPVWLKSGEIGLDRPPAVHPARARVVRERVRHGGLPHFVVQTFTRKKRQLIPDPPLDVDGVSEALTLASAFRDCKAGVIAFEWSAIMKGGRHLPPAVLARYGQVPPECAAWPMRSNAGVSR